MTDHVFNVVALCTGKPERGIVAEAMADAIERGHDVIGRNAVAPS